MNEAETHRVDRYSRLLDAEGYALDCFPVEGNDAVGEEYTGKPNVSGLLVGKCVYPAHGNQEIVLAPRKVRSKTGSSDIVVDRSGRGIWLYLVVFDVPKELDGDGKRKPASLDIKLEGYSLELDCAFDIDDARLSTVTNEVDGKLTRCLQIYPGVPKWNSSLNTRLPAIWRVTWSIAGGDFEFGLVAHQLI